MKLAGSKREGGVIAVNTGYSVTMADHQRVLNVTASGAAVEVSIPAAGTLPEGFYVVIRRAAGSDSNVTVTGGVSRSLTGAGESLIVEAGAAEWIDYPTVGPAGDTGPAGPNEVTTSTDTDLTGTLRGNGTNVFATKDKLNATTAPAATNDTTEGYAVGSRWVDVTNHKEYVCLDATEDAAVWSGSAGVNCKVKKTENQSLNNSTTTVINFDGEDFDTNGLHDNSTNNSRITIPSGLGGKYLFIAYLQYASNTTGARQVGFFLDGTTYLESPIFPNNGVGGNYVYVLALHELTEGQYMEVIGWQNSGGALDVEKGCRFSAIKVG